MNDDRDESPPAGRSTGWRTAAVAVLVGLLVAAGALLALGPAAVDDPTGGGDSASTGGGDAASRDARSEEKAGRALFARMGCGNCHAFRAGNSTGSGAPNLDAALARHTRESLREKIIAPYGRTPPDSFTIMPTDFGRRMSEEDLDALVTFLLENR